jgi:hypothetical protein
MLFHAPERQFCASLPRKCLVKPPECAALYLITCLVCVTNEIVNDSFLSQIN